MLVALTPSRWKWVSSLPFQGSLGRSLTRPTSISANAEKQLGDISSFGKEVWDISSSGTKRFFPPPEKGSGCLHSPTSSACSDL